MPRTRKSSNLWYPKMVYSLSAILIVLTRRERLYWDYLSFAISSSYVREYFCFLPLNWYYILYPLRVRVTGEENGTTLFSTEKSRKSREDPSTSSKKRIEDG